jgi:hypothetical protein
MAIYKPPSIVYQLLLWAQTITFVLQEYGLFAVRHTQLCGKKYSARIETRIMIREEYV